MFNNTHHKTPTTKTSKTPKPKSIKTVSVSVSVFTAILLIMNVLDSPLEALALNYVRFGFLTIVNNLWTWVAVITAAVSFWRIRAVGSTSCSVKPDPLDSSSNGSQQPNPEGLSSSELSKEPPAPALATRPSKCHVNDGVTKGKFTMYYEDESDGELTAVKEWGYNNNGGGEGCGEWWERVMSIRMGDLGWYKCQDLTAINGNVVRLWDDCNRVRYSSSCTVW